MGLVTANARERFYTEVLNRRYRAEARRSGLLHCESWVRISFHLFNARILVLYPISPHAHPRAEAQREERERKEKKEEEARRQQQHEEMQKRQEEQRAAKKRLIQNEATSARGKIKHYRFIANSTTQEFSHFTLEQRQSVLQECDELERWLNARQESTTFEHIKKSESVCAILDVLMSTP